MDDSHGITTGSRFLSSTGRIWTVRAVMPDNGRVALSSPQPDGEHGAVIDIVALLRMVRIDHPAHGRTDQIARTGTPVSDLTGV